MPDWLPAAPATREKAEKHLGAERAASIAKDQADYILKGAAT
jgi:hypothetical protein